jgi:HK97 family phage major capsid protein
MTDRTTLLANAKSTMDRAKNAGRPLTPDERVSVRDALDAVDRLDAERKSAATQQRIAEDAAIRKSVCDALRSDADQTATTGDLGHLSFRGLAGQVAAKGKQTHQLGTKALIPAGTVVGTTSVISDPVPIGKPIPSLLAALPARTITDGAEFSYLRQTQRTNNAAPVAPGAEKPVSSYGLTEVKDDLRVVAHLSEEVPRYWLEDDAKLQQFLDAELRYGLATALEEQIVSGDGVAPNMRGLANTSGIVSQAFNTDAIRTARSAISALMALGATNDGGEPFFVFGLADWEAIETASLTSGEYVMSRHGTPVNAAERRLWGTPVVLAPGVDAGFGWLVDPSAVQVVTDGQVRVEWNSATGFSRNTVIARCETRVNLAVKRPAGIARLDLSAA